MCWAAFEAYQMCFDHYCAEICKLLIHCISNWLAINVLQFTDIVIAESGKFLGWHLGRQSATLAFPAPIKKFVNRVHEICLGKAPAAVAVIRCDQNESKNLS